MNPWTRDNTKDWIHQVESRIQDIDYYLKRTIEWCEYNDILSEQHILINFMMTIIWVSSMRQEPVSYNELCEILGLENVEVPEDQIYEIGPLIENMDHEEMLKFLQKNILI